ncbi:MAG: sigma-70 family RNA polymerase sigma factor [Porphyromonadaceae bacterium]|nr:sigma-70 family RNA polymerase sigma factor [Porphyromonadaceae bacterium]
MISPTNNNRENVTEEKLTLLFQQYQAGSVEAFNGLYDHYVNMLFNFGCKLTDDRELLKDCIHDVFIKMYHNRSNLENVLNFRSYLFVSLKNRLCDELRKTNYISGQPVEDYHPVSGNDVENEYIEAEKSAFCHQKITSLMNMLSTRQREAITLYYLEEKKYEDICVLMGINYQSLRNLIHRGLTKLRDVAVSV